ncbi:glycosyltransferase family 2 protein [Micromonospora sp. ATA32]|nr:glycosyltransferase family 2 protein [Micromonospora sp. ATA32]
MSGLTVITVLYRSSEILAETLPTWVHSANNLPVKFIFADNRPGDGCEKFIESCLDADRYVYIPDSSNPGFATSCNMAVAAASTSHVLFLNPDVWLNEDSLVRIHAAIIDAPDVPIAVGLFMHGRQFVGIDLSPIGLFVDQPVEATRGPLGPSGGAAVFPTGLFRQFGGFYDHLFAWGEDADLAYRLYASGIRTRTLALALPHKVGHSVDSETGLLDFRAFLLGRNRILVAARTLSWPLLLVSATFIAAAHFLLAIRRARQGLLRPFLRGVGRGLLEGPMARREWRGKRFGILSLIDYLRVRRPL